MYLRCLEMTGFKSFCERTRIEFSPGITAIVGPNGCGKSNVADAIRWVLGEQSPKALRGRRMEDCIFNGTDQRPALNMAEVSLTLAECEGHLPVEYDEVTITRRFFRSGEGQYFINKTPCRLKDIHRLFMGTGISTSAYSLLEQGKIDQILSSHPEDRREVFEEAAGITKYKTDKQEALRKLETTEQNLLRLQDVLREVKRQIGSLQRQAGKARRYKALREELQAYDVFAEQRRIRAMDEQLAREAAALQQLAEEARGIHEQLLQQEEMARQLQTRIEESEDRLERRVRAASEQRTQLDQARARLKALEERISELEALAQRDEEDHHRAQSQAEAFVAQARELDAEIAEAQAAVQKAETALKDRQAALEEAARTSDEHQKTLNRLRTESLEAERGFATAQNSLLQLESREQANVLRVERLKVEKSQAEKALAAFDAREQELAAQCEAVRTETRDLQKRLEAIEGTLADRRTRWETLREERAKTQAEWTSRKAQIELLEAREAAREDFPCGARLLMESANPLQIPDGALLGSLAALVDAEPSFRPALQAVLRAWSDALVARDPETARDLLERLRSRSDGTVRLLCANRPGEPEANVLPPPEAIRLLDHIRGSESIQPLLRRLLGMVFVWVGEGLPPPFEAPITWVTRDGLVLREGWIFECGGRTETAPDPMSRKLLIAQRREEAAALETTLHQVEAAIETAARDVQHQTGEASRTRQTLDDRRRELARQEAEWHLVHQEAQKARQRRDAIAMELETLLRQTEGRTREQQSLAEELARLTARREELRTAIEEVARSWQAVEEERRRREQRAADARVALAEARERLRALIQRRDPLASRIRELQSLAAGRAEESARRREQVSRLKAEQKNLEQELPTLEKTLQQASEALERERSERQQLTAALRDAETRIAALRAEEDRLRDARASAEIAQAERKMNRDQALRRVTSEYGLTLDQFWNAPPLKGPDGAPPSPVELESRIAEIRSKLEEIGPVNLVAIEEYQELEERLAFLSRQHDDLVASKAQLLEAIRKINETSAALFAETFAQINAHFEATFQELFGGGSARLEMPSGEDVLEAGIEIIARPPGKRLQNISLLSGGERTMAAVALLFAIYRIRPSPFCVLDELDAALDESNISRFIGMLRNFLKNSQFIVITHNRRTIAEASVIYGVTMPEQGVSKIVSMRFEDDRVSQSANGVPAPAATP